MILNYNFENNFAFSFEFQLGLGGSNKVEIRNHKDSQKLTYNLGFLSLGITYNL